MDASLLIPVALLYSLAHWQSAYWAMTAISNYGAVFLAVVIVWLLQRATRFSLIMAALMMGLLMYTQGNGIFLLPFALAQIHGSKIQSPDARLLWLILTAVMITVFVCNYTYYPLFAGITRDEFVIRTVHAVPHIMVGFIALVGATPFLESDAIAWSIVMGILVFSVLAWMLFWMWHHDARRFYPTAALLSYLLISLMACAIARIPLNDDIRSVALDSHYKIYSLVLYAVALIFLFQQAYTGSIRYVYVGIALLMLVSSYIRYLPIIKADYQTRREEVTAWSLAGTHRSLGWLSLTEQVMFMSVREGFYSPFDGSRGVLDRYKQLLPVDACPPFHENLSSSASREYQPGTIAMVHYAPA